MQAQRKLREPKFQLSSFGNPAKALVTNCENFEIEKGAGNVSIYKVLDIFCFFYKVVNVPNLFSNDEKCEKNPCITRESNPATLGLHQSVALTTAPFGKVNPERKIWVKTDITAKVLVLSQK
jgi:hypothetical protein